MIGDPRGSIWCKIVFIGFSDPVSQRFFDEVREPAAWPLLIHVWSFSAWLSLLAIQAWLAATRRMEWHRTFGVAMLPLAAVMVWSAETSEVAGITRNLATGGTTNFLALSVTWVTTFSVFVVLAWLKRKTDPAAHKRLLLMATAAIFAGAHVRALGHFFPAVGNVTDFFPSLPLFFAGTWIIICTGMAYDLATRKALHPVYKYAALPLLASQVLASYFYASPAFDVWLRPILTR